MTAHVTHPVSYLHDGARGVKPLLDDADCESLRSVSRQCFFFLAALQSPKTVLEISFTSTSRQSRLTLSVLKLRRLFMDGRLSYVGAAGCVVSSVILLRNSRRSLVRICAYRAIDNNGIQEKDFS